MKKDELANANKNQSEKKKNWKIKNFGNIYLSYLFFSSIIRDDINLFLFL